LGGIWWRLAREIEQEEEEEEEAWCS